MDWEPYKHAHGWDIIVSAKDPSPDIHTDFYPESSLYFPDAAALQRQVLRESGEPPRPLSEWAFSYGRAAPLSHHETWALQHQRDVYCGEYQALFKSRGVDFIISPAYPAVAAVMGESHYWNYTAIWNVLDLPSAVFPSGLTVDLKLDALAEKNKNYKPRNEVDEREWLKYQGPERYEGVPIALQIAGRHFKDEETLAAAKVVEGIMKDAKEVS